MPDQVMLATANTIPARIRTWTPMRAEGYRCDQIEFDLDYGEHLRRQAAGLGAFPDFRTIETLMNLPGGHPIDYQGLSEKWRKEVRRVVVKHPGAIEADRAGWNHSHITRLAVPPAQNCLALVYGKRFALGHLNRASRFAPMGRRGVVYPPGVAEKADPFAVAQYGFYGVGIGVHDGDGVRWILEPGNYERYRHTPAAWWFAETVYEQWLLHGERIAP